MATSSSGSALTKSVSEATWWQVLWFWGEGSREGFG